MHCKTIVAQLGAAVWLMALALQPVGAADGAWPNKPIRLIVPAPVGVTPDLAARQLADHLGQRLGQPVVVENKPGAAGNIGMQAAARSAADGYTLVLATYVPLTVNPALFPRLPYDPVADFEPVSLVYQARGVLVARPDLGPKTLRELMAHAKAKPGQIFYGSGGVGTPPHMTTEMFKYLAGVDMVHVPFSQGAGAVMAALLGGSVSVVQESLDVVLPHIQSGKLVALAVMGPRRIASLPDTLTFDEAGVPGMPLNWAGLLVPAGTPAGIVQRLQLEVAQAASLPAMKEAAERGGRVLLSSTPQAMADLIRAEIPKWRALVQRTGIKAE